MTMTQISKEKLGKLESLAPLLKKAKLHIEELNAKLHRKSKFAALKIGSAELAAATAEEVKVLLEEKGIPEELAAEAAERAGEAVAEAQPDTDMAVAEGGAPIEGGAAEAINPETAEQLSEVMEELPPDVKSLVAEMVDNPDVNKMAKLMIPILKKVAKKSAFSSLGKVTSSNEAIGNVEKTAALNALKQICK